MGIRTVIVDGTITVVGTDIVVVTVTVIVVDIVIETLVLEVALVGHFDSN